MTELKPRYAIGDRVYHPQVLHSPARVTCPDCLGSKCWSATLPCGDTLDISCPTCTHGYEVRGTISSYEATGRIDTLTIGSIRTNTAGRDDSKVEYMCSETGIGTGSVWAESKLYPTRESAEGMLGEMVDEARIQWAESRARDCVRSRRNHPGSMVAAYRAQIRKAKKDIEEAERGLAREASS